jgi:hypothetical protein
MPELCFHRSFALFGSNFCQFAGVEPITATIGTLIHFDPALSAEKMAVQPDPSTTRAIPLPGGIDDDSLVASDVEQRFARGFTFIIDAIEFERIKPDSAAAFLTNIHDQAADLRLGQFIEASWAFHKHTLPQNGCTITWSLARHGRAETAEHLRGCRCLSNPHYHQAVPAKKRVGPVIPRSGRGGLAGAPVLQSL